MIRDATILCFASEDWGGSPLSKTHLMRRLARDNRIFFIESVGLRRPRVSSHDVRRAWTKLRRALAGPREVAPNLMAVSPFVLPFHQVAAARWINRFLLRRQLASLVRRSAGRRVVLWIGIPTAAAAADLVRHDLLVYHCADKFSAYAEPSIRATVEGMDRALLRRADLILTPSREILQDAGHDGARAHLIVHGVDDTHFARALDPATPEPPELAAIGRPRIGFFGVIDEKWLDLAALEQAAALRPEWHFVLVGSLVHVDPARWATHANIHWLGWKPYEELPAYCRGFDAGMIPFARTELTTKARPLKAREYLAAGLPVVSTVPPEDALRDWVRLAAPGPEGLVEALGAAMREDTPSARAARAARMKEESWDRRAEEVGRLLADALATRG